MGTLISQEEAQAANERRLAARQQLMTKSQAQEAAQRNPALVVAFRRDVGILEDCSLPHNQRAAQFIRNFLAVLDN